MRAERFFANLWTSVFGAGGARRRRSAGRRTPEPLEHRALPTTYVVTTAADVVAADGLVSLREAIQAANTNAAVNEAAAGAADGDLIRFDSSLAGQTITLANGEFDINEDVVITGFGAAGLTIDAAGLSRVFNIDSAEVTRISWLTLRNGAAPEGGAVSSTGGGVASLFHVDIFDSTATGGGGGAVYNQGGRFYVTWSKLSGNDAAGAGGAGGAVHNAADGVFYLSASAVDGNTAALEGGGVWSAGRAVVLGSRVTGNTASGAAADDGGGGVFNSGGALTVAGSTISNNTADGAAGSGGGVFSTAGTVNITGSLLNANTANRAGGGVEVVDGTATIRASTLSNNVAGPSGSAAPGNGGGLHVSGNAATVRVTASWVTNNTAALEGGGLWNQRGSRMIVTGTAFTGNQALGRAADDGGGAIFNNGGVLDLSWSQFSGNTASGNGGALHLAAGGTVTARGVNIANNTATGNGGGVYNNAVLNMSVSSVRRNRAADGGGVFTDAAGATDLALTIIFANTPNNLAGPGVVT